jgi:hypothetical protein
MHKCTPGYIKVKLKTDGIFELVLTQPGLNT